MKSQPELAKVLKRPPMKKDTMFRNTAPTYNTNFTHTQNKSHEGDTMKQIASRRYNEINRTKAIQ
jgi:hypothetical protein